LGTVNDLSRPDPKLKLVNSIFRSVVHLDQLQRTQALRVSAKPYVPILRESSRLNAMLDTLRMMSIDDSAQLSRVESMKRVLQEWDGQFLNYVRLRTDLIRNDTLTAQIKALSEGFAARAARDSLVATNLKKTTIVLAPS